VHGANRLASNSLLEGLVVAERIADHLTELPVQSEPLIENIPTNLIDGKVRKDITETTTTGAGAVRTATGLNKTISKLEELATKTTKFSSTQSWEATNLLTVSSFLSSAALRREESRGSHWRSDFPERNDERWLVRIQGKLNEGKLELSEKALGKK
jgi:L-aspartate oxidase